MEFQSILDLEESSYKQKLHPVYFLDLNLDPIIERIQFQWGQEIAPFFYYFPENEACENYRREIFQEVKKEPILNTLTDYVNQMRERRTAYSNKCEVDIDMQRNVWHIWEIYHYCNAYENLYRDLQVQDVCSKGLKALCEYLDSYIKTETFQEMKKRVYELQQELIEFQMIFTIENDLITLSQGRLLGSYDQFLMESFPEHKKKLRSPFHGSLHLSNLELELIQMFRKQNSAFFKKAERFYKDFGQYEEERLLRFELEIGYYMAFYRFEEEMKRAGFEFAMPSVDDKKDMYATGLYDLALACANYRQQKEVISNDMAYHGKERFFVVTGPNQGGKTTFARSLGQLVYFTKMGLDVPAVSANVHYYKDILTHFSVEESIKTGRGKLKEELDRLAPMMSEDNENTFVIINELFTTAANYDACIMGKRVLKHFLEQQCRGVYVTHIKELSEAGEEIVSLRALVEEVEHRNIRRFKMLRSPAEDIGYASDLVEKYGLTYEQLKERLL